MEAFNGMKKFHRKELRDIWYDEPSMVRRYQAIWNGNISLQRLYRHLCSLVMQDVTGNPVVELGGGSGLFREFYPQVKITDINPFPGIDVRCDASKLPLKNDSVGSFVSIGFLHHCVNPRRLFEEIQRTLKPGGRFVLSDPAVTPVSRIIFKYATHEGLDMLEPPFEQVSRQAQHPLLEANIARACIIFEKNRKLFEQNFPGLRIVRIERHNLFRNIISGSFIMKSSFPEWMYPVVSLADTVLHPLNGLLGMLMKVVLEKR